MPSCYEGAPGDVGHNRFIDIGDALLITRCTVGLANPFFPG
ncbi:hypothetical protein N9549_05365 [Acidimicrobiales bacterium]|nr:hypothetical protein [Acidimicrobiales bacterium]MDG1089094.1 hypothetical protein [Acidimicrobiales bacterium]